MWFCPVKVQSFWINHLVAFTRFQSYTGTVGIAVSTRASERSGWANIFQRPSAGGSYPFPLKFPCGFRPSSSGEVGDHSQPWRGACAVSFLPGSSQRWGRTGTSRNLRGHWGFRADPPELCDVEGTFEIRSPLGSPNIRRHGDSTFSIKISVIWGLIVRVVFRFYFCLEFCNQKAKYLN